MKAAAYSLVEVLVAAAILAVGLAAAAVLINTLVIQQEMDSGAVRAANLQEQATMLYRLGVTNPQDLYSLLPEPTGASGAPAAGSYSITFGVPSVSVSTASAPSGVAAEVAYEVTLCTITHSSPVGSGGLAYSANSVSIIRPVIRVGP